MGKNQSHSMPLSGEFYVAVYDGGMRLTVCDE